MSRAAAVCYRIRWRRIGAPARSNAVYYVAVGSPSSIDEALRAHVYAAAVASVDEVVKNWNDTNPDRTVGIDDAELRKAMSRVPDAAFIPAAEDFGLDFSVQLAAHAAVALADADQVFRPAVSLRDRNADSPAPLVAVLAAYRTAIVAVERRENCSIANESRVRHLHGRLLERLRVMACSRREGDSLEAQSGVEDVMWALWRLESEAREPETPIGVPSWWRWSRRHTMVARNVAAVSAVIVVAVLAFNAGRGGAETGTPSPEVGVAATGDVDAPDARTTSRSVPAAPSAGFSGTALLKNTRVSLAALTADGREVQAGQLPTFAPLTIEVDHGITFRLRFSMIDRQESRDNLTFFIQPLDPVKVQGAHQVLPTGLQSLSGLDTGNDALVVPGPAVAEDGTYATYEFVLAALTGQLNNGYFCGYTPKPVTVIVSSNSNDLAIPYPVFIKRDC